MRAAGSRSEPIDVHLLNAYSVSQTRRDSALRAVLTDATANFPDGKPLSLLTRFTRRPLLQVRGPKLFGDAMDLGRAYGLKHFLLGNTDETLVLLRNELESRYPGVHIVGVYSPPFRDLTKAEGSAQDELIRRSGAHITWVGLGTPKQDFEASRLAAALPGVTVAIGAAFDFVAGTKREAPAWITHIGMEWLFRFATEPRRLWRRYLIGNLMFLYMVIRWARKT